MSADDNIKTVKALYEAFGRGEVATILEALTDDIDWAGETSSTVAPWYGTRQGKAAVAAFFDAFGSTMEVEEFRPLTFAANDDSVLTVVLCRAKTRAAGKPISMNLHHWFQFRDGKICFYRGTEDTAQTAEALA